MVDLVAVFGCDNLFEHIRQLDIQALFGRDFVQFLNENLLCPELGPAVGYGDLVGELVGQVDGILDGCVAAADGEDSLIAVERAVASCAVANLAHLPQFRLAGYAKLSIVAAGSEDHRAGEVSFLTAIYLDFDQSVVAAGNILYGFASCDLGTEFLGLVYLVSNQVGPGDGFPAGVVLDPVCQHDLPAGKPVTLEEQTLVAVSCGVEPCGQACRTSSDHDYVVRFIIRH